MANHEHLQILLTAISSGNWSPWSQWRKSNPDIAPDLKAANLQNMDLQGVDLNRADLKYAQLQRADLSGANLTGADLRFAELRGTNFTNARLTHATVDPSALRRALNAKLDATEQKKVAWRPSGGGKAVPSTAVLVRLRELIQALRSRLSRLAPGLFEHEELVTLELSQREVSQKNQNTRDDMQSRSPGKPVDNRK